MADAPQHTHPDDLRSDLDLLIEMVKDGRQDQQVIVRHYESLKTKLEGFVHRKGTDSGGDSAS